MSVEIRRGAEFLGQGSCLATLDAALDYLRYSPQRVLPGYLVAMTPFSLAMLKIIDTLTVQHAAALPGDCLLLTAATLWRWGWLAWTQRQIQIDIGGRAALPFLSRLAPYLAIRLLCFVAMTWGGFVLFPAFYGFFLSGMAAPALMEQRGSVSANLRQCVAWLHNAGSRLVHASFVMLVLFLMGVALVVATHAMVLSVALPTLLGADVSGVNLTVQSTAWLLSMGYFCFVCFDLFWTVAGVMFYFDVQSRRQGSDLWFRVNQLAQGVAA